MRPRKVPQHLPLSQESGAGREAKKDYYCYTAVLLLRKGFLTTDKANVSFSLSDVRWRVTSLALRLRKGNSCCRIKVYEGWGMKSWTQGTSRQTHVFVCGDWGLFVRYFRSFMTSTITVPFFFLHGVPSFLIQYCVEPRWDFGWSVRR